MTKMGIRQQALVAVVGMLLAGGCATQRSAAQPQATGEVGNYNVTIYRGVDANANNGRATLSPSQFRFNPDMSTFDSPNGAPVAKACNYSLTVTGVANQPAQPGDTGTVAGVPGNFVATFDNNPAGHWGVAAQDGTSNQVFSTYAQANRGQVVNGTQNNCN